MLVLKKLQSFRMKNFYIKNVDTVKANVEYLNERLTRKVEGTIAENWIKYWKNVFVDYKDVIIDVGNDIRTKPIKAASIGTIFGGLVYCTRNNPGETEFKETYIESANKLILMHPSMQNKVSSRHLQFLEQCYNEQRLRRLNLGIASIMWTDYYSNSCSSYEAVCPHLRVKIKNFKDRIVDIGFLNKWWVLDAKMTNYDINY